VLEGVDLGLELLFDLLSHGCQIINPSSADTMRSGARPRRPGRISVGEGETPGNSSKPGPPRALSKAAPPTINYTVCSELGRLFARPPAPKSVEIGAEIAFAAGLG